MKPLLFPLLFLLSACSLNSVATPKTIAIEAGTSIRHDVGEDPSRITSIAVKGMWELRK